MLRSTLTFTFLCFLVFPSFSPAQPTGKKYAVIVGVQNYDGLSKLKYTEKDATELGEVLKKSGYKRVIVLTEGQGKPELLPTGRNIRKLIKSTIQDCDAGDTMLIGLSGHGVQFKGDNQHYFCPYDTDLDDPKSLVSLREMYDELKNCKASYKLMLVDACRNDPEATGGKFSVNIERKQKTEGLRPPGGIAALFSCSEGQFSFESEKLGHGVFFHFVIEGLKGKAADRGQVDLLGLARYTMDKVPDYVADNVGVTNKQKPNLIGDISGKLPLLTVGSGPGTGTGNPSTEVQIGERELKGHKDPVTALGFSPDSKTIYTGGADKQVRAWDLGTGREIWKKDASGPVASMALSRDGTKLAVATGAPQVALVNTKDGSSEALELQGSPGAIHAVALGGNLLHGAGEKVFTWEFPTGRMLWNTIRKQPPRYLLYLPASGKVIAAGGTLVGALEGATGKLLWEKELEQGTGGATISGLAGDRDGRRLAVTDSSGRYWLLDTADGKQLAAAGKQGGGKSAVALSPDGDYLLRSCNEQILRLILCGSPKGEERPGEWKIGGPAPVSPKMGCFPVSWSPSGAHWAVGRCDGVVVLMPSRVPKK
jgi:hypothetical protein